MHCLTTMFRIQTKIPVLNQKSPLPAHMQMIFAQGSPKVRPHTNIQKKHALKYTRYPHTYLDRLGMTAHHTNE